MLVMIKATDKSKYRNLVDIIDEINEAKIKHYFIVDTIQEDKDLIMDTIRK